MFVECSWFGWAHYATKAAHRYCSTIMKFSNLYSFPLHALSVCYLLWKGTTSPVSRATHAPADWVNTTLGSAWRLMGQQNRFFGRSFWLSATVNTFGGKTTEWKNSCGIVQRAKEGSYFSSSPVCAKSEAWSLVQEGNVKIPVQIIEQEHAEKRKGTQYVHCCQPVLNILKESDPQVWTSLFIFQN